MSSALRPGMPPLPARFAALPLDHRGYPVPFFVAIVDGVPDFRVADGLKRNRCVNERLCWLCGQRLGSYLAFVVGPMCAVNRISSEPPSHRECAEFALRVCRADGSEGVLFEMGEAREVQCWAEGRAASRDEIAESFESGVPLLMAPAHEEGEKAVRALERMTAHARTLLGIVA